MVEQMSNEKKLDVICLGAAVVDIPLRPVSRDIFDIESYPVDRIAMSVGGDAMNEDIVGEGGLLGFEESHCQEHHLAFDYLRFAFFHHQWATTFGIGLPVDFLYSHAGELTVLAEELQ